MSEFWNEQITNKSFEKLQELKKEIDFVLIGGWAIYVYTKAYKSKDIDIIIDYQELYKLKSNYSLSKNDFLKKYEIKLEHFDVDIYVPKFSNLNYPLEKILKEYRIADGFKLPSPEVLVFLKMQAYGQRKGTIKGKKDSLDVVFLLLKTDFNIKEFLKILVDYKMPNLKKELTNIIKSVEDKDLFNFKINRKEFLAKKKNLLSSL